MSRQSTLYYDGYDPSWIIGTGKPPPLHPPQINRPVTNAPPYDPVQANVVLPVEQRQLGQGPGTGKKNHQAHSHGTIHHAQSHPQKTVRFNLGPVAHSHVTGSGTPNHQGVAIVGSNPNPYLQPPVVHTPGRVVNAHVPGLVRANGPAHVSTPGLPQVTVNPIFKVVMWVPLCCQACEKKWKEKLTNLPGFQGYDVERKLDRVSVFGHVNPATVLATMQKVVPRAQMWRQ